jgi:hypothetical protein
MEMALRVAELGSVGRRPARRASSAVRSSEFNGYPSVDVPLSSPVGAMPILVSSLLLFLELLVCSVAEISFLLWHVDGDWGATTRY